MLRKPPLGFLAYLSQTLAVKRAFESGIFKQIRENLAAALLGVRHVVTPRVLYILLYHCPELQRDRLRKAVINIVERR